VRIWLKTGGLLLWLILKGEGAMTRRMVTTRLDTMTGRGERQEQRQRQDRRQSSEGLYISYHLVEIRGLSKFWGPTL
jgi:hypothetical protein